MSQYEEMVHAAFGETAKLGRTLVPGSFYPVQVTLTDMSPAKRTGTPGAGLSMLITEGPFASGEVEDTFYMTPGNPDGKGKGIYIGKVNHMIHVLSGQRPDYSVLGEFDVKVNTDDPRAARHAFAKWFATLEPEQKTLFMTKYGRTRDWGKAIVIAEIDVENEQMETAEGDKLWVLPEGVVTEEGSSLTTNEDEAARDEKGQPIPAIRSRNRIETFYPIDDPKHGLAVVKKLHFPQQEEAKKLMEAAG